MSAPGGGKKDAVRTQAHNARKCGGGGIAKIAPRAIARADRHRTFVAARLLGNLHALVDYALTQPLPSHARVDNHILDVATLR